MGLDSLEKKVADHYNKDHPQGQPQQPQQPAQPQQQAAPPEEKKHHGEDVAKRLGHSAVFGVGATVGSNAVNSVLR